jgi:hypothetical protein
MRTNPDEAANLRKQEEPFVLQVRAIRKSHLDRVVPQIMAIQNETVPGITGVSTEVPVNITVRKDAFTISPKAERVQIAGSTKAAYDGKELRFSLGLDGKGRHIEVGITGSRSEAETIANLLASSLNTITAKK